MFRSPVLAASLALAAALAPVQQAAAFDIAAMSDEQRQIFREEVRAYLLDNPEVLNEMLAELNRKKRLVQIEEDRVLIAQNAAEIFADGRSWVGGNPAGDITLVEFLDYNCGYCKRAFPEVEALLEQDGNIRFVVKELPVLGESSVLAARFAIAVRNTAGQDAYEAVHNGLMQFRGEISEASLRMYAIQQSLDPDAVFAAMMAPEVEDEISANYELAEKLLVNGTPGFVFGDRIERGYVPLDYLQALAAELRG